MWKVINRTNGYTLESRFLIDIVNEMELMVKLGDDSFRATDEVAVCQFNQYKYTLQVKDMYV